MPAHPLFYTYLLTNWNKTVLYTGCTNDIAFRLVEHWVGKEGSFSTSYKTYYLVWMEPTRYILNAIALEKKIKLMTREKKETIISETNPEWMFLNEDVLGCWPPTQQQIDEVQERWRHEEVYGSAHSGLKWW